MSEHKPLITFQPVAVRFDPEEQLGGCIEALDFEPEDDGDRLSDADK